MPSFSNDVAAYPTATVTATHPRPFDPSQGKPTEKNSVGNTFLWTNWPNGDANHLETPSNDRQLTNGSALALNGPRSSASSYTRELPHSKDGSMHSLGNGSARDHKEDGRPSATLERNLSEKSLDTVTGPGSPAASIASQQINGTLNPRSLNGKPLVNGDFNRQSTDEFHTPEYAGNASATRLSTSPPDDAGRLSPDPDRLSPSQKSPHRYSSPPAPENGISPDQSNTSLRHRHTLQVPRTTSGRRGSRDQSEDMAYSSGRLSPTTGTRRTSFSLARRATRTNQSESLQDEAAPDEDAARWAEAIKQRRASKRRRRDEDDDDRVIVGTKVDQNHVNYVTAYNMLTGIRFTVSRINAKMDRELTPADFEAKHKFSFDITGNELTPSAKYDFKFKDYAPWVFRHLRAKFRLDPADYLMSLTSKYILSELGSPGKSGSFFYFSRDYKYIIKTIHHSEHKLLRKILPEYYRHVEQNPNTLISQFYGLHRVKMAYGRKIHFVVMNNLFPPHRDIHQTFDLKGSMIGRDLREEDLEKNPRATLKDLNWVRRNREIQCGPSKRDFFLAQLKRDVELLQKLKIMDYSLLVGIHDVERGNEEKLRDKTLQVFQPGGDREEDANPNMLMRTPSKLENERKARELRMLIKRERPVPLDQATAKMPDEILDERKYHVFYADDGGFRATHENGQPGEEIYYLGIIDCLTHYGMVKKLEHFFKGLSHDRTQISPIPPESYGDRFINFIKGITMSKEEAQRQREAKAMGEPSTERTPSVEETMQAAEREASRESSIVQPRTLTTVRDPNDSGVLAPSTLPIVEEAGEASSLGGHSSHSRHGPPVPEKDLPPIPHQNGAPVVGKGKGVVRNGQPEMVSVSGRQ
ncbi:1-phosphatidylinositol-4-phosphate 5-kinase [Aspergillus brunneoviolaceus CBS 621.78]|uniref:Multicopy suppressor of Stt4 mutation n=1 Tax=Aspergillus brunneoviolaceus CBS 621.78 TaxID=1450534 RepID=A0ACD1G2G7_9EURO|nr:multicopy suppressor of Stt4 mutation [Aspergillus brunneoviolaceus CBS 621.78]RAH43354.1 multicopy suppressor of Stt4 mutation [Aspergillus brunneoviolaceus CBS 621.78]